MTVRSGLDPSRTTSIRLLFIEDSEDDALLLLRELRRGGLEVEYERVDSAAGLRASLDSRQWDMVLADHNLPGFDAFAALEIVRDSRQDLPVIIVSGTIGEGAAVDAMRAGAADYIMKDKLARLLPAVERELREREVRQAKRQAEATIQHLAYHDSLTGLVNRAEFERRLARVITGLSRYEHARHALLYMDLDQFKLVNDTCGHAAGDELLKQLSALLHERVRERDTFSRVGGDEFCLLLENCGLQQAFRIAEDMRRLVQEFRFVWQGRVFSLGASIGIVPIDRNTQTPDQVLSAADLACYAAKDKGRNCIQVYQERDDDISRRRGEMAWARQIDAALEEQRFLLYRQQIVPLNGTSDRSPRVEILLRLRDEDGNIIAPGAFIPAAERYQRMPAVDRWVIEHALEAHAEAGLPQDMQLSINLSGRSLSDETLVRYVKEQLRRYAVDPRVICFEVTETAAISSFRNARKFISGIRELGCRMALDDFGSGMSSFSYLKSLEIDFLKIDGAFVRNVMNSPMDRAIVEAINGIGHKAGIRTIAEYVETAEIQGCLEEIGVDYAQGFAVARPEPLREGS